MKAQVLTITLLLAAMSVLKAQMPKNSIDGYDHCVEHCRTTFDTNSGERMQCIAGCSCKCPNLDLRALNTTTNLAAVLDQKSKEGSNVLIHTDPLSKGKTYAEYKKGLLVGYFNVYSSGASISSPILVYAVGKVKRYFIYDTSGKYLEVVKPEVKFTENIGVVINS